MSSEDAIEKEEWPAWKTRDNNRKSPGRPMGSKSLYLKSPVKFTPQLRRKFLQYISQGYSRTSAAAKCGISRSTAYKHIHKDERFAEAVGIAMEKANANLESELYKRIHEGSKTVEVDADGNIIKTIYKDNDRLLVRALEQRSDDWKAQPKTSVNVNLDTSGGAVSKLAQMLGVDVKEREEIDITDYESD